MQFFKFFICSVNFQVIHQRRHLKLLPWMAVSKIFQISYSKHSTRRWRKSARTRFFANKRLQVKNRNLFFDFFFDNPTGEAFMYIMWKNQHCIFLLSRLFCSEIETRYTSCMRYTLCVGDHLWEQNWGFLMNFLLIVSP